jgi:hypothetical protein
MRGLLILVAIIATLIIIAAAQRIAAAIRNYFGSLTSSFKGKVRASGWKAYFIAPGIVALAVAVLSGLLSHAKFSAIWRWALLGALIMLIMLIVKVAIPDLRNHLRKTAGRAYIVAALAGAVLGELLLYGSHNGTWSGALVGGLFALGTTAWFLKK